MGSAPQPNRDIPLPLAAAPGAGQGAARKSFDPDARRSDANMDPAAAKLVERIVAEHHGTVLLASHGGS